MKSSLNRTVDVISGLVQKHIVINNRIKQNTLNQQNYLELDNRLDNLQKLIDSGTTNSIKFYKCRRVNAVKKTWEGYEVTFDSRGIANISTELTTGLQYTAVTPLLRQNIYSADGVQQIRGAMMSGPLPTPIYYASYETPGGNIWAENCVLQAGDGDNKAMGKAGGYTYVFYQNLVDGQYLNLPGFPESASAHDWAFSIWGDDLRSNGILQISGADNVEGHDRGVKINLGSNWISFNAQYGIDGTTISFTPLFNLQEWVWRNLVVSYNSSIHKYTLYIDGEKYTEVIDNSGIERPFDFFRYNNNSQNMTYVYLFPEQITAEQAKLLAKQRWIFEGLQLSGLNDVYNADYGMDVSPNGTLTESGTYMFKPKYYASDPESGMSTCNIQWNGNEWEIFVYEYDENWNSIKKVIAVGRGGNDPSEAEWNDVGYGLAKIDAKYANNI